MEKETEAFPEGLITVIDAKYVAAMHVFFPDTVTGGFHAHLTRKERDSLLIVRGNSFLFKASLRRAPDTGEPSLMGRCVGLPG